MDQPDHLKNIRKKTRKSKIFTVKQQRFINEYLKDGNASRAALDAGYSEYTAGVIGCHNLQNPEIANEIQRKRDEYQKKFEIRREYMVEKLYQTIAIAEQQKDKNALLKAIDILNKMSGQYTSTVVNVNVDTPLFPDVNPHVSKNNDNQ